jgi:hypothetical protein
MQAHRVTVSGRAIARGRNGCATKNLDCGYPATAPWQGSPGYIIHVRKLNRAYRHGLDGGRARFRVSAL